MNKSITINDLKNKDLFKNIINLNDYPLPKNLLISTMTIICKFKDTDLLVNNIAEYIELEPNGRGIVSISLGTLPEHNRRVSSDLSKRKTKRKQKRKFYNQVTMEIFAKNPDKLINCKIFNNGTIQLTGCKSVENLLCVLNTLFSKLSEEISIITTKKEHIYKPFATNMDNLRLDKLYFFNIVMINCNFDAGYKIDREELFSITKKNNIIATYEPGRHACVNIKYQYIDSDNVGEESKNKQISIFVFESGKVIITGSSKRSHIIKAYDFITNLLSLNKKEILLEDLDDLINDHPELKEFL
jgi:TATA-box binding protein (TBP) (component of TFIID and TFIIIB)